MCTCHYGANLRFGFMFCVFQICTRSSRQNDLSYSETKATDPHELVLKTCQTALRANYSYYDWFYSYKNLALVCESDCQLMGQQKENKKQKTKNGSFSFPCPLLTVYKDGQHLHPLILKK